MGISKIKELRKRLAEARDDDKGFTLMEMLIVVAIIAILIAIAIPTFTGQLENSRESTDAANLRSAYATASAKVLTEGGTKGVAAGPITLQQTQATWTSAVKDQKIGNYEIKDAPTSGDVYVNVAPDGTVSIASSVTSGYLTVDPISGEAASGTNAGGQG